MSGRTLPDWVIPIELQDGRHGDVSLASLQQQLARHQVEIVFKPAALVLDELAKAPKRTLIRDQDRDDWRGRVAGAELTRRLDEFARNRSQ